MRLRLWPIRPCWALWACGLVLWLPTVGLGLYWLERYTAIAGARLESPADWPADTGLQRAPHRLTLVLALHPRCPCSRATVRALADLLARHPDRISATILLYQPAGAADDWEMPSGLPAEAAVVRDPGAVLAQRFGAVTSGHVLLFDEDGRLAFSGGLTRGRGQEGDSVGRQAVLDCLRGTTGGPRRAEVFGCPLSALHGV